MRKLYYCTECGFIGNDEEGMQPVCPQCGATLHPSDFTQEYWESLSPVEKHKLKNQLFGNTQNAQQNPIPERVANYVYYCEHCNNLEVSTNPNVRMNCEACGAVRIPLGITENAWDNSSADEKRSILRDAVAKSKQPQRQSAPVHIQRPNARQTSRTAPNPRGTQNVPRKETQYDGLSIAALVLSFVPCLSIVGLVLAIIDIARNKSKHTLSYIALGVFALNIVTSVIYARPELTGKWASSPTDISQFDYKKDPYEKKVIIEDYNGKDKKVWIPSTYEIDGETYTVDLSEHDGVFVLNGRLFSVILGEGIVHAPANTFNSCGNLKYIYLPSTITAPEDRHIFDYTNDYTVYFGGSNDQWTEFIKNCKPDQYQYIPVYVNSRIKSTGGVEEGTLYNKN